MYTALFFPLVLGIVGLFTKAWLLRQDIHGRAMVSLGLLSISMYIYGYALYGACHGEVNFLRNPFACTREHPIAYNPGAYRISRAR